LNREMKSEKLLKYTGQYVCYEGQILCFPLINKPQCQGVEMLNDYLT